MMVNFFLRLVVKIFQYLRLMTKFLALSRLTVIPLKPRVNRTREVNQEDAYTAGLF